MAAPRDASITLPDGRRLAYTEWGDPDGKPVFYFHGMPGSRLWCPDSEATAAAGVRLIIPDRPGIGRSDPLARRTLADWPRDVEALSDALEAPEFAIIGVSGGGPYAAACAALAPGRLSNVAIVSSRPLTRYNWAERPTAPNEWHPEVRAVFELAKSDPAAAADLMAAQSAEGDAQLLAHPESIHEALMAAEGDRWFFEDGSRTAPFDAHMREALRQGPDGYKWEYIDVFLPWGFRLADIAIPVSIWRGSQDPWVTQEDVEFQVATIPRASLIVWPDSGHLGLVKHWREILEAVA